MPTIFRPCTFKEIHTKPHRAKNTGLLCESRREGKKFKTKTILNLSRLPEEVILSIENKLKPKTEAVVKEKDIFLESCYDFGYVLLKHFFRAAIANCLMFRAAIQLPLIVRRSFAAHQGFLKLAQDKFISSL